MKNVEKTEGHFYSHDIHDVMHELALKRVVYHSGALIGNDVRKTLRPENILKFASVFEPRLFTTKSDGNKVFSNR